MATPLEPLLNAGVCPRYSNNEKNDPRCVVRRPAGRWPLNRIEPVIWPAGRFLSCRSPNAAIGKAAFWTARWGGGLEIFCLGFPFLLIEISVFSRSAFQPSALPLFVTHAMDGRASSTRTSPRFRPPIPHESPAAASGRGGFLVCDDRTSAGGAGHGIPGGRCRSRGGGRLWNQLRSRCIVLFGAVPAQAFTNAPCHV